MQFLQREILELQEIWHPYHWSGTRLFAGEDVDYVVETMRGHDLARIITEGPAIPNTGVPGMVGGVSKERVIHSPGTGRIHNMVHIADIVEKGQILAYVGETPVEASITGVLRGIIKEGYNVPVGMKIADIDPRKRREEELFLPFRIRPDVLLEVWWRFCSVRVYCQTRACFKKGFLQMCVPQSGTQMRNDFSNML